MRTLGSRQDLTQVASSLCISTMGMAAMGILKMMLLDMEFVCALIEDDESSMKRRGGKFNVK